MNIVGQSNFLQALGWAVLNSLWQMALLWIAYLVLSTVMKSARPAHKATLASTLLIAGFAWFIYTFTSILITETGNNNIISSGFVNIEGNTRLNEWLSQTLPIASVLYLFLLVLPLLHFVRNFRYVQVIRHHGLSKADVDWRIFVRKVAAQMGINKPVHIWISELVTSPVTIGYLKPVILVPLAAVNNLSVQQLEAVLLHELAHIRRFDYFINLVLKFIQSILYFNPFVKAFVKIVEREREKSCDEMVIQYQYDPYGYASALLVLEKNNLQPKSLIVAAAGKKNDLLHRIEWIMGIKKKPVVSFNKLAGMLAGLLCIIALNAFLILSKPVAQSSDPISSTGFSPLASPLYFFTGEEENIPHEKNTGKEDTKAIAQTEFEQAVINNVEPLAGKIADAIEAAEPDLERLATLHSGSGLSVMMNPFAMAVANVEQPVVPELKEYQEIQVKQALDASRKVLQEGQWKELEKNIADVFTQQQKEELRKEYLNEMSKLDLKKWEEKLRISYNKVDWERVNSQLAVAVNNIRIDSLQHVYVKALENLSEVEVELKSQNITCIPDTDISIQSVERKKLDVQKELNRIRAVKTKRIIKL